jgi:hypothetical protein
MMMNNSTGFTQKGGIVKPSRIKITHVIFLTMALTLGLALAAGLPGASASARFTTLAAFNPRGNETSAVSPLHALPVAAAPAMQMMSGCASPSFTAPTNFGAGDAPESVAMGDFNLDGKPDLATANFSSNNVTILLGNGSGGFTQPAGSPVGAGDGPSSVAVGDFNLDGKPDLAVANGFSNNVTILLGNGSGSFTQPAGSPVGAGNGAISVAVGDFNFDGKPDLAVANNISDNVTIRLNTCDAQPCSGIAFAPPADAPASAGNAPESVAMGDFNLDGKLDLATAGVDDNKLTILLGNAAGGFTQAAGSPISVGSVPVSVAVGDFNLDGKPDLAVANNSSANVTILLGNGAGGFAPAAGSPVGVGFGPAGLAVGDFNRDGQTDLAVANIGDDDVTVLLGNGSGGFTQAAGSPVSVGNGPVGLAMGDFNLDGKLDLAAANSFSANVTILLGNGSGGFTQAAGSPLSAGTAPYSVAVSDFNLDGKPDLAAANLLSDNVTILLGNGSGAFTQPAGSPIGVGDFPTALAGGDFNLDGKPDLAVSNSNSDNVTILLGNGSGGFTKPAGAPVGVGDGPNDLAVGDFNRDGKPDFATANEASNNVTIRLNTCTANTPPTISALAVTRAAGSPASNSQIATVNDAQDAENILTVTVNDAASATANGVTVSGLSVNAAGQVTATVGAACAASNASFTLRVTDSGGLFAESTLHVTVSPDATPPVLSCPSNIVVYLPPNSMDTGMAVNYPAPTANDNCTASPVIGASKASGSVFPVGTTTVTVTAKDAANNQAMCSFTVTVRYNFTGFFQPVDNLPTVNQVSAGQSIPVKFSLSGNKGLAIFAAGYPVSQPIACSGGASLDDIEQTVTSGASSLSYDAATDTYTYVWKTEKSWRGTCRQLIVRLNDGTDHIAYFRFK